MPSTTITKQIAYELVHEYRTEHRLAFYSEAILDMSREAKAGTLEPRYLNAYNKLTAINEK